ncbi:MAG TPA: CapA family protein [Burkholderiales bacterium]|nr:CapA family protein [Burkholderiales bacterium]
MRKALALSIRLLACALALDGAAVAAQAVPPASGEPQSRISIAFVGQALIKHDICKSAPESLAHARESLRGADVAFTNLEVAIQPPGLNVAPLSRDAVPAPPAVLDCLKAMGFNVLSLANNHAFDLRTAGLFATIDEVRQRGFTHAGTGADAAAAAAPGFLKTGKGRVALVAMATGAVQLVPETWAAPGRPGVNYLERMPDGRLNPEHKQRILETVRAAAREAQTVIAYHHNHDWGGARGSGLPPDREKRIGRFETQPWAIEWARELIDAGASVYVAHGDPTLHGVEIYKGRLILHGLGNYIFHSVGGTDRYGPLAYVSVVATAEFSDGRLRSVRFRPVVLSLVQTGESPRGTPYLAEGAEAEAILQRLAYLSQRHGSKIRIDPAAQTATLEVP